MKQKTACRVSSKRALWKRLTAIGLLATMLILPMTACRDSGSDVEDSKETTMEEETTTVDKNKEDLLAVTKASEFLINGTSMHTSVTHEDPTFDFTNRIEVPMGSSWSLSSDADGKNVIDSKSVTLKEGENTYYVTVKFRKTSRVYTANIQYHSAFAVEFYSNCDQLVNTQVIDKGQRLTTPADPQKEGYTFLGWFLDGKKFDFTKAPTESCTLIAHWEKDNKEFSKSNTAVHTITTLEAGLHVVWKDYADLHGMRPDSVTCVLTQTGGTSRKNYEIIVTADGVKWKKPASAPAGVTISQGEGGAWSLSVQNLPAKVNGASCQYTLYQLMAGKDYTTKQSGTAAINTLKGYAPAADRSVKLTTRNGRLYDAAGNMIVLKGVVTINTGVNGFEKNVSSKALGNLKAMGCNGIRVTAQLISGAPGTGSGYVYYTNGSARTGDYNDGNATRVTQEDKDKMIAHLDYAIANATKNGLYVVIDWGILTSNPNQYLNEAKEFFGILSKKHANNPYVIYEICNEPVATWGKQNGENQSVKAYAEKIIDVIRGNGSDAIIIVAPNQSATALSAFSGTAVAGDDPIDDPFDDDRSYNVAFTFHCYPYNYKFETYSWKLRDAHEAGLTVITTEMSPMDGTFDSPDTMSFDMLEMAKFMRLYQQWDMSFFYFRYFSYEVSGSTYHENLMFIPFVDVTSKWTRDDLTMCGKWYYDWVNGNGAFCNPNYTAPRKKDFRANYNKTHEAYGLGNVFPGFAESASISGNTCFYKVCSTDDLGNALYASYCKLLWERVSAVANGTAQTTDGDPYTVAALPKERTQPMELTYSYKGALVTLTLQYGKNTAGVYGLTLTVK